MLTFIFYIKSLLDPDLIQQSLSWSWSGFRWSGSETVVVTDKRNVCKREIKIAGCSAICLVINIHCLKRYHNLLILFFVWQLTTHKVWKYPWHNLGLHWSSINDLAPPPPPPPTNLPSSISITRVKNYKKYIRGFAWGSGSVRNIYGSGILAKKIKDPEHWCLLNMCT